jgi:hypothetical protein
MSLQIVIPILECIHIVFGVCAIPVYRIYKGGSVFMSTMLCWGLWIVWAFTWCVILPAAVYPYSEEVLELFPQAIGVSAVVILAWVPSLLVCLLARGVIAVIKRRSKSGLAGRALDRAS